MALGFTLAADFFLILHDWHLPGVAVFCFAHLAYILRAITCKDEGVPGQARDGKAGTCGVAWRTGSFRFFCMIFVSGIIALTLAFTLLEAIFVLTALYATLFIINIYVSARYLRHNQKLAITGLLLFAACDICVMIFNLPVYMGAPQWLRGIFPMIFVFYLPSQLILAISAVDFGRFASTPPQQQYHEHPAK